VLQRLRRREAAETASDDHDVRALGLGHQIGATAA
jgi:hypothetical protein